MASADKEPRDGPCDVPVRVLAQGIRNRKVSATEALDAHLARIEKYNGALRAVVSLDLERARQRARAADDAVARGENWGPLHGIPMTLKDAHDVAGMRTTVGTELFDRVADEDGAVAARLRAAGANIIGHTNVAPFLADYQSANAMFGRTANPWDTNRTSGGSSGGAAAAVAAGMTPLDIGSDLAGSVRLPAHFCGVYGLKATEHRVPLTGFFRQPERVPRSVRIMTCLGPMARDLDDLELALSIIAGPDAHDGDVPPVPLGSRRTRSIEGLRLAVAPTLPGVTVARSLVERIERIAGRCSDLGARVETTLPEVDWAAQGALFGDLVSALTGLFDPNAQLRDEQRSLAWYFASLERRDHFIAAWQAFFGRFDALLLPPGIGSAFVHRDNDDRIVVDGKRVSYGDHGRLLAPFNLTGLPALVVPSGEDGDGLPIGLQIVGPLWSETSLLDIARALEEAMIVPGFRPPPGYS